MGKTISQQPPFTGNAFDNTYFVLDQLVGLEYSTFKISGQQMAAAAGLIQFPTDTLTADDIGKLVMNKNGKAVVANRDTPRPAQAGQWTITVNSVFEMPVPTTIDFTFSGLPVEGDYIVLGLQRFVFKAAPTNPYDIQIGADIVTTIANASNLFNALYPDQWTASNDGVSGVSVIFNAALKAGLDNPLSSISFGLYYGVSKPDQVDAVSELISLSVSDAGNEEHIRKFNDSFLSYGGIGLGYFDVSDPRSGTPFGTELFGIKWAANVNDQSANIVNGINVKFSGKLLASAINNVITVSALTQPDTTLAADITLAGRGASYLSIVTDKYNIAANPDWISDLVIGTLTAVTGSNALINTSSISFVALSGTASVSVADIGNDLSQQAQINRVLVPATNGSLESFTSISQAFPAMKFDRWFMDYFYSDNIFYALSNAAPGENLLVKRGLPLAYLYGLTGGI